jgi:hypothetical protein
MGPVNISNNALSDYIENEKQRAVAAGGTLEKKRLVCIGSGSNQHLECWDDNWMLPFKRLIAFFQGGSSLDFAKVTEFYVEKGLHNGEFEKTIRRYYSNALHKESFNRLQPTTQTKLQNLAKDALSSAAVPANGTHNSTLVVKFPAAIADRFAEVRSGHLEKITIADGKDLHKMADPRNTCFLQTSFDNPAVVPPVTIRSEFIPDAMLRHLMEDKADLAVGQKSGDIDWIAKPITNVEAIYAQLQVQLVAAHATGDIVYQGAKSRFQGDLGRPVIVSTNIHPDYELPGAGKVMALLTEVTESPKRKLLADVLKYDTDEGLLDALVHHHTADGLPSLSELTANKENRYTLLNLEEAKQEIEKRITGETGTLQNVFVKLPSGEIHSLEALYTHYLLQLKNELLGLESLTPHGYVYTIDPPQIFARQFDSKLMTRLQILAFKQLNSEFELKGLKVIGFNEVGHPGTVDLLKSVFGDKAVAKVPGIYSDGPTPKYMLKQDWALVIHNNSDAFGNNLVNEGGFGSLDAAVGALTTAAVALRPSQPNRLTYCYPPIHANLQVKQSSVLPKVNYLLPNVMMGGYPSHPTDDVEAKKMHEALFQEGVTHFVSLMEEREVQGKTGKASFKSYKEVAKSVAGDVRGVAFENLQIPDVATIDDAKVNDFIDNTLLPLVGNPANKIYIHCHGGNGRSSLISTVLLSRYEKVSFEEALERVFRASLSRRDPLRPYLPESYEQFEQMKALSYCPDGKKSEMTFDAWREKCKKICEEMRPDLRVIPEVVFEDTVTDATGSAKTVKYIQQGSLQKK